MLSSNNASVGSFNIPVTVEIVAPITATPAQVQFPSVKVGDSKELVVVVKGDKPFKIVEVKGGDGLIKAVADGTMSKQALDSPKLRGEMQDVLLGPGQLYEALRERRASAAAARATHRGST